MIILNLTDNLCTYQQTVNRPQLYDGLQELCSFVGVRVLNLTVEDHTSNTIQNYYVKLVGLYEGQYFTLTHTNLDPYYSLRLSHGPIYRVYTVQQILRAVTDKVNYLTITPTTKILVWFTLANPDTATLELTAWCYEYVIEVERMWTNQAGRLDLKGIYHNQLFHLEYNYNAGCFQVNTLPRDVNKLGLGQPVQTFQDILQCLQKLSNM